MKKIYMILAAIAVSGASVFAQGSHDAVTACTTATGGVVITYDDAKSCKAELKAMKAVGFHSGANGWQGVVNADATGAIQGKAAGSGKFTITIADPKKYYGAAKVDKVDFVFNQFPLDAANQWGKEGKGKKADATCEDFSVTMAGLKACAGVNVSDLTLDVEASLSPNPMSENAQLFINSNETFRVAINAVNGQVMRTYDNVNGTLTIEKDNLTKGLYFVVITNKDGKFQAKKLVVE